MTTMPTIPELTAAKRLIGDHSAKRADLPYPACETNRTRPVQSSGANRLVRRVRWTVAEAVAATLRDHGLADLEPICRPARCTGCPPATCGTGQRSASGPATWLRSFSPLCHDKEPK